MKNTQITPAQTLLPVTLLAIAVFGFLSFQALILTQDNTNLQTTVDQQTTQLEQVEKVKAQLNALVGGTLKLAHLGDKDAASIIMMMKKSGVNINEEQKQPTEPAK